MQCYLINTDQAAIDPARKAKGLSTYDLWFTHRMAFAGDKEEAKGKHARLFEKVRAGNALFMYHSTIGYVGVGIVEKNWDGQIHHGSERLLYTKEACEYRIEVRWMRDWRHSPRNGGDGLPVPHGRSWQQIDERQYPLVRVYASLDTIRSMEDHDPNFEETVALSVAGGNEARRKRIEEASTTPRAITVVATVYQRNPDIVVEVLRRANGLCESCRQPAPFARKSDGSPHLEVHHIEAIASGGSDSVMNSQALCPNCHRKAHYG